MEPILGCTETRAMWRIRLRRGGQPINDEARLLTLKFTDGPILAPGNRDWGSNTCAFYGAMISTSLSASSKSAELPIHRLYLTVRSP
jgi:hypothetical protein